ncbi:MAG: hypothetical protein KF716_06870 [Anaerolineae bacterium]|nr:hypothetical protein [Anaerolineae bacterium]
MLDVQPSLTPEASVPTPPALPAVEPPDQAVPNALRGLMIIVLIGTAIVLVALLLLQWPIVKQAGPPADYGPQFQRILVVGESSRGIVGAIVDVSVYAMLIAAIVLAVRTLRTGRRDWLSPLIVVGLLGLAYVTGMVLYIGPMVGACGFSLIIFGGLVGWIASNPGDEPSATPNEELTTPVMHEDLSDESTNVESGAM